MKARALVLDAGALIAYERAKQSVAVVAEVWRGGPRSARIAKL